MLRQALQVLVVERHKLHQRLPRLPRKPKVGIEVCRQLHPAIVLKVLVQDLQDAFKRSFLLSCRHVEVLHQAPCSASQRAHQVDDCFTTAIAQDHLCMVQLNPLPPFSIVSRLSREHRDVGVALCRALRWCSGSWHSLGSPYLRIQWSKSGAGRSKGRWYTVRGPALGSAQQGQRNGWLRYQCKSQGPVHPASVPGRTKCPAANAAAFSGMRSHHGRSRPPWANMWR